jgi:hypothetical protein
MRISFLLFCFLCVTLFVTQLWSNEIYVNNLSGDDTLDGGEANSAGIGVGPVRTIQKALRLAQSGDRIILAKTSQPYRESVTLQGGKNSGVHGSYPLVIEGNGALLDGTQALPEIAWEHFRADVFRARTVIKSHQILFLNQQPAERMRLDVNSKAQPILEPLSYFVWDGYLYFRPELNKLPGDYETASGGLSIGLTLYDVHNVLVKDIVVQGYAFDGVNAHDNVSNVKFENVTCLENGRSGFTVAGSSRVTLDRCTAKSNHEAQLRVEEYATVELSECELDLKSAPAVSNAGILREVSIKDK